MSHILTNRIESESARMANLAWRIAAVLLTALVVIGTLYFLVAALE